MYIEVLIHLFWLLLYGIFGWYVLDYLAIPDTPKLACRIAIVGIVLLDAFSAIHTGFSGAQAAGLVPLHPLTPATPSIVR